jgi:hypothetical protein
VASRIGEPTWTRWADNWSEAAAVSFDDDICDLEEGGTWTHTPPAPTAIPRGPAPTAIVAFAILVAASMRVTVSSSVLATQTEPAPTAMPLAPGPTAPVAVTTPAASMRETLSSRSSTTHVAPRRPRSPWAGCRPRRAR